MNTSDPAILAGTHLMRNIRLVSYFDVAAVGVLVSAFASERPVLSEYKAYDYLLTFSDELEYVWRQPTTPITLLFYFVRYMPIIDTTLLLVHENLPLNHVATFANIFKTQVWFYGVGLVIAHVILILRTCAIWSNDSRVAIGLGTLLICFAFPGGYFVARYNDSLTFSKNTLTTIPAYIVTKVDTLIFVPYATFVAFETVILILTLWKIKHQQGKSAIHQTLYRDCVLFYVYLLSISLVNIILLIKQTDILKLLVTQLHRVLHSVVLGRVVLNIREAIDIRRSEDERLLMLLYGDNGTLVNVETLDEFPLE